MPLNQGFSCSKHTLILLNAGYILVALILIVVGSSYGSVSFTSVPIVGGIVACGVGLLFVAFLGLYGTIKHHQVMLFFYMTILFLIFLIQFAVACAALAVGPDTEKAIVHKAWNNLTPKSMASVEVTLGCCGFESFEGRNCTIVPSCGSIPEHPQCLTCLEAIRPLLNKAFNSVGWIGLIFSLVELVGIYSTYKYRVQIRDMTELP